MTTRFITTMTVAALVAIAGVSVVCCSNHSAPFDPVVRKPYTAFYGDEKGMNMTVTERLTGSYIAAVDDFYTLRYGTKTISEGTVIGIPVPPTEGSGIERPSLTLREENGTEIALIYSSSNSGYKFESIMATDPAVDPVNPDSDHINPDPGSINSYTYIDGTIPDAGKAEFEWDGGDADVFFVFVRGEARVGQTLTAVPTTEGGRVITNATYFRWQTYKGGVIKGAEGPTYKLTAADVGKSITASIAGVTAHVPTDPVEPVK